MTTKRYGVIDNNNVCVNVILIDDPMPKDYWPGYGAKLICLSGAKTASAPGLPVVNVTPNVTLQIGDTINISTGVVTKMVTVKVNGECIGPQVTIKKDLEPTKT